MEEGAILQVEKKRWRVSAVIEVRDSFIVEADTPEDAVDLIRQGFGRRAGQNQKLAGFEVQPMEGNKDDVVHREQQRIVVPKGGLIVPR